jgi:hypothetical protein
MKKLPTWIKAIPESLSHGSGTLQKRLWRVVSDYVRVSDWYTYKGVCVATGAKIAHWSEGDAGHYKSYAVCRGLYKFNRDNIHLQSKKSNGWGGQEIGHKFGETLTRRYGKDILDVIERDNNKSSLKFTDNDIIDLIKAYLELMEVLPEQPAYFKRAFTLLHALNN